MTSPETVVVIPSWNGIRLLDPCLAALRRQTYRDFCIVVVDDASTDNTFQFLKDRFPEVDTLRLPQNVGFARAVNRGLRHAVARYNPQFIAVLNNDTVPEPEWLAALVQRAKKNEMIAAVTSNMFFADHPGVVNSQGGTLDWNGDGYDVNFGMKREEGKQTSSPVFGACWGASLLRASALADIGLLDEAFGAYFEDLDWSWRAHLLGYEIHFEPGAEILHEHSATYRTRQYKKLYLCKRNALRAALKNYAAKSLPRQVGQILLGYWFAVVGYFQESKHHLSLGKKFLFSSIPLAALAWNIRHLPGTLRARRQIQRKRTLSDRDVLALAERDATPVREWLASLKRRFSLRPLYDRATALPTRLRKTFGVNVFGFFDSESGVGEAARSLARSLRAARIPSALINSPHVPHRRKDREFKRSFTNKNPFPVNVIAIYGDMFADEWDYFGDACFSGRHNIAYWAWELEKLPDAWVSLLDRVDEVWVPSAFVANAIRRAKPAMPVMVVPHAIQPGAHPYGRGYFNIPEDKFVFLTLFDFYSLFERKNPLAVVRAFKKAFEKDEPAELIVKCVNGAIDPENFSLLQKEAAGHAITIMDGYRSREEITSLMNAADCVVSLHRSEGFGLTLAEAMALRKPVIATNYSGNTDFMTAENSFPVPYSLVPVTEDHGPYRRGNMWADPDIDAAAREMRFVYENREVAVRKGHMGAREILSRYAPGAIGRTIEARLKKILPDH